MARFRVLEASPWVVKFAAVGEVFESDADYIWIKSCLERKIIEHEWTVEQIEKKKREKLESLEHGWAWYEVIKSCDWIDHEVGERFRARVNGRFIRESITLKVIKMVLPFKPKPFKVPARPLPRQRKPKPAKKSREEREEARRLRQEEKDRERERREKRVTKEKQETGLALIDAGSNIVEQSGVDYRDPWLWRGVGGGGYQRSSRKVGPGPLRNYNLGPGYEGNEVGYGSLYHACYYNTYER